MNADLPRVVWEMTLSDGAKVKVFLLPLASGVAIVWHRNGRLEGVEEHSSIAEALGAAERLRKAFSPVAPVFALDHDRRKVDGFGIAGPPRGAKVLKTLRPEGGMVLKKSEKRGVSSF